MKHLGIMNKNQTIKVAYEKVSHLSILNSRVCVRVMIAKMEMEIGLAMMMVMNIAGWGMVPRMAPPPSQGVQHERGGER